jgi:hypothetical protein
MAFVCRRCDRSQSYAPADRGGGVTQEEAEALGWTLDAKGWKCPFCSLEIPGIDKIASLEHEQWQHWTEYMLDTLRKEFVQALHGTAGSLIDSTRRPEQTEHILNAFDRLPCVTRWRRQIEEPFEELSEREQESDRDEVRVKFSAYRRAVHEKEAVQDQ